MRECQKEEKRSGRERGREEKWVRIVRIEKLGDKWRKEDVESVRVQTKRQQERKRKRETS